MMYVWLVFATIGAAIAAGAFADMLRKDGAMAAMAMFGIGICAVLVVAAVRAA